MHHFRQVKNRHCFEQQDAPQNDSREELAEKTGLSRSYLSAVEAPNMVKTISLEMLFDISDALSVEPYKLLEFKE